MSKYSSIAYRDEDTKWTGIYIHSETDRDTGDVRYWLVSSSGDDQYVGPCRPAESAVAAFARGQFDAYTASGRY